MRTENKKEQDMIKCFHCGKDVSSLEQICPYCNKVARYNPPANNMERMLREMTGKSKSECRKILRKYRKR